MTSPVATTLTPRLVVSDASAAIAFYVRALGAVEVERFVFDGTIAHALITVDGQPVALKDADGGDPDPLTLGGTPVMLSLEVADVDAVAQRMVAAGARVVFPVQDHGYGYRDGRLEDPFGHLWLVATPLGG